MALSVTLVGCLGFYIAVLKKSERAWGLGSSGRVLALQMQSPEFKLSIAGREGGRERERESL
jgi:hypothetical protein